MEEYKSNSHRSKESKPEAPAKRVEKVIRGKAKTRKKNAAEQFANDIIANDIVSVATYIKDEVLVPAAKKLFLDIVNNGASMLVGEPIRSGGNGQKARLPYYAYSERREERRDYSNRGKTTCNYEDIIFDHRGDAEEVLERMGELIERFDQVSIGDVLDMSGLNSNYTDNKYGWMDISTAHVIRTSDGYKLKLPRPIVL